MFDFFNRKKLGAADALTNQTLGGQSVLYRIFTDILGCEASSIRLLELTYLAASVTTYVYLRLGAQAKKQEILDEFTKKILSKSAPDSEEDILLSEVVLEYRSRFTEYRNFLDIVFDDSKSSSGNPSATLLMRAFENTTQLDVKGRMVNIVCASSLIEDYILDHIDFVKKNI